MLSPFLSLRSSLRKGSFTFKLLVRGQRTLLYEQIVTKDRSYYLVFKIIVSPAKEINGRRLPASEKFPSGNDESYTYANVLDAEKKFQELESKKNKIK